MTIARAQAHELLATPELAKVRDYLNGADLIVKDVQPYSSTSVISRRLPGSKTFSVALSMKSEALERRIAASKPTFCH